MPKKFLYIGPEENIAHTIDKISSAPESILYLAVDANPAIITDAVNIKFLKKEIAEISKHIVIASKAPEVLVVAQKAGFETTSEDVLPDEEVENEEIAVTVNANGVEKPSVRQENIVQEFEIPDAAEGDNDPPLPVWMRKKPTEPVSVDDNLEEEPEKSGDNQIEKNRRKLLSWKFISISTAAAIILAIGIFYLLAPKVTLSIIVKKMPLNLDFKVSADTTVSVVDAKNNKIPGQSIKLEKEFSDQFSATGVQDNESKAEGKITIYNEFGASSQKLVKNTRFKSKNGSIFRLKNDATVPGATMKDGKITAPGIISADVVADQAGPSFNIEPSDFTIPGFEGTPKFIAFYGKSSEAMTGGSTNGVKFATKEDLAGAQTALVAKFKASEDELISDNITKGSKMLPRAKEDPVFQFSAEPVGSDGKFTGKLKASEKVLVFSESDIDALVGQYLSDKLAEAQTLDAASKNISYSEESLGANHLSLNFTVKINQSVKGKIDEAKIKTDLAGKNEEEMKNILKGNEAIESAEFSFWPIWVSVAPKNSDSIIISINE